MKKRGYKRSKHRVKHKPQTSSKIVPLMLIIGVIVLIVGAVVLSLTDSLQYSPVSWGGNTGKCSDSDGGLNYFEQGLTCIGNSCISDSCLDGNTLREYYCEQSPTVSRNLGGSDSLTGNNRESVIHECGFGCVDGSCDLGN